VESKPRRIQFPYACGDNYVVALCEETPGASAIPPGPTGAPGRLAAAPPTRHAASAAALHCEAGGAEPPRDAVRVVDNVRTTRPDLLLHSREPGGMRMPSEVKSIAFGMSRYSTRWHLDGATWTERRAAEAVKERDAVGAPRGPVGGQRIFTKLRGGI
jgi:hypothetical protein